MDTKVMQLKSNQKKCIATHHGNEYMPPQFFFIKSEIAANG